MFTELNQYRVVLSVKPEFQHNPSGLQSIYLRSAGGGEVPLSAITHASEKTAPLVISRLGQFPAVTASFNLAPGASLGGAVTAVENTAGDRPSAEHTGQLPGDCPGVQGIAVQRSLLYWRL